MVNGRRPRVAGLAAVAIALASLNGAGAVRDGHSRQAVRSVRLQADLKSPAKAGRYDERENAQELVKRYCVGCHNARTKAGGLGLDAMDFSRVAANADVWEKVVKKFVSGTPEGITLAVIEADKIVDDALKNLGLDGEHMADRLGQLSEEEVKGLDALWRAHRLRNNLVHSPDFKVSIEDAERALDAFENFLKQIKAL